MSDAEHRTLDLFTSSDSDEWATPPDFVRALARAVDGFTLDPAAGAESSPVASDTYTVAEDGLHSPWYGTVWCNPPYSEIDEWTDKAVAEARREPTDRILYLVKGDSSTEWWQTAVADASVVCMVDRRLSFGDGDDSAPFASHLFVFGRLDDALLDVLDRQGTVFLTDQRYSRTEQARL